MKKNPELGADKDGQQTFRKNKRPLKAILFKMNSSRQTANPTNPPQKSQKSTNMH
jgi:hypothetical protein